MAPSHRVQVTIFGEVLFDCFQIDHKELKVLGGAPFNICWHLQALTDNPNFISRVGHDELAEQIIQQASEWGISVDNIQRDNHYPTGKVQVTVIDQEPHYDIKIDSAYDFIDFEQIKINQADTHVSNMLYHGSLALRTPHAKAQFKRLVESADWDIFLDVNLRKPWWDKESLFQWVQQARWVKLNIDELRELGFKQEVLTEAMQSFQKQFGCEQVIVTQGADGVTVLADNEFLSERPEALKNHVDTVGAGDAFTAVYIHGLVNNWPLKKTLQQAQTFASQIIGIRGAIPTDRDFYAKLKQST